VFKLLERFLPRSSLRARWAKGAFYDFAGTAGLQLLLLLGALVTARTLGKEKFGELGIIQATITLLGAFTGLGLGQTATKHVAELRASDPLRAGRIVGATIGTSLVAGSLLAAAIFFSSPRLALILKAPGLVVELEIASLILWLSAVNATQVGALSGVEAWKDVARGALLQGVTALALIVATVRSFGLEGVLGAQAVALFLRIAANQIVVGRRCHAAGIPVTFKGAARELELLFHFGLPVLLTTGLLESLNWTSELLLCRGSGYSELGIFNAAQQWRWGILVLTAVLGEASLPIVSDLVGRGERDRARRFVWRQVLLNAAYAAPLLLALSVASPWIMGLYGAGFREDWRVLVAMSGSAVLLSLANPPSWALLGHGRPWLWACLAFCSGAVFLAALSALLPWGALGLALAYVAMFLAHLVFTAASFHWISRVRQVEM
jgi:O-antigen/teichoic acid export membrane protein